jgi:uncharacterized protein with beta-barrel porin domain
MKRRKTKVVEVSYGRREFLAVMVVLVFCLSLFCSDASALYSIFATGSSNVWGLNWDDVQPATGSEFGTVSAIATYNDAYGLLGDFCDVPGITIDGDISSVGVIFARSGTYGAYGLYSYAGSINTDALNGTIVATSGYWRAVGLFSESNSITTGDIGGTITAEASGSSVDEVAGSSAFGLRCDNAEKFIETGAITGTITATAGGDRAYGFRSYGDINITGDIDGTITATAHYDDAYGLSSGGLLTTRAINGTIAATAAYGSYAYGLYSGSDMNVGDIGSDAEIIATAYSGWAFGLKSEGTLTTGDINGTITATVTNGNRASALRSMSDMIIGDIGSDANISATASNSGAIALCASGSLTTGAIDGKISATATNGSNAYGLYSEGNTVIGGNIGTDAEITATAGDSYAYGLYSNGSLTTHDINGMITATATTGSEAYGLYSVSDMNVGNIDRDAEISAMAGGDNAAGLYSDGNLTTGEIHGYIFAEVINGSNAAAIGADSNLTVGNIGYDAYISAWVGDSNAAGLYSEGSLITGAINGEIYVTAGDSNAAGLYSVGSITTGAIDGTITATATDGSYAYGLYSGLDMVIDGNIGSTAEITATAYNSYAAGLASDGSLTTRDINGTITATATSGSYAYGLYSSGDMDVCNIDRDAVITATTGNDEAAGLYSANGSITTGAINGTITATAGGVAIGSVYGLYANDDITTGAINGEIAAEMTIGSYAYGLYSENGDINTGDIGSDAHISAQAGDSYAYGLYSQWGTVTTGDIDGTIDANVDGSYARGMFGWDGIITGDIGSTAVITAWAGGNEAAGLYSANGSIDTNNINGSITATAVGDWAYGLRTHNGSITTDAINGDINATAGGNIARGLGSWGDITTGDITGTITATAGGSNAAGLYSMNGSITTGDINGTITATAITGTDAYGLYSVSNMTIGNIDRDANITAWAQLGEDTAAGLYSRWGTLTTGAINGKITAEVNEGYYAYGLYSYGDMNIGDIGSTAEITATAYYNNAYGLYSDGSLTTGDINGTITAEATTGYDAYGLRSHLDMNVGNIDRDAEITAWAQLGGETAAGLFSDGNLTTGAIHGYISAEVNEGSSAYGIGANSNLTINGDIGSDAQISATAGVYHAYGLYSRDDDINITGDIDGTITAFAGDAGAVGLYAPNGSIETGDINGTITARTDGVCAYGLWAGSNMTIGNIDRDANITAWAESYDAIGLYSGGSLTTGAIHGKISAEVNNGDSAYGLKASSINITGDIGSTAEITAWAETGSAYGLYGGSIDITGNIDGKIAAEVNNGSEAIALCSTGDLTINGDIGSSAHITARAGTNIAVGLIGGYYGSGSIDIEGDIDGTISAEATNGSGAYGLYADSINITGDIGSTAQITAWAETGSAYGLWGGSIDITGDIDGTIAAEVNNGSDASGLSAESITITGSIDGQITATTTNGSNATGIGASELEIGAINSGTIRAWAQTSNAIGLWGGSILVDGDIDGTITAEVNNGPYAYGLYTDGGDIEIDGEIAGTVTAKAARWKAVGIYSEYGSIYTGDISGDINATSGGSSAFGLRSDDSEGTIETGNISGTIRATAGGDRAFGLRSDGSIYVDGDISGTITAKADGDYAIGLHSGGPMTINSISGTIDANAGGDYAYGILSYDEMDVNVDGGTISAVANGDGATNVAAIQSGKITVPGLVTQDVNDTVRIVAGSTIVGNIDLGIYGDDNDLLTLSGSTGSTALDYNVFNVEDINIKGGQWFVNGNVVNNLNGIEVSGGILSGTGWLEDVYVVAGGTLNPGPFNSIGTINVRNLTFDSGGTYEVEVNDSGNADKVNVSGTATLDENSKVSAVALERIRHSHDNMLIIDAPDAEGEVDFLIGQFDSEVESNKLFTEFSLDYDYPAGDVFLNVDHLSYATYAVTDNERSIGDAFDDLVDNGGDTGDMDTVISAIEDLPDGAAANAAYDQIMPQDALGLPDVTRIMMNRYVGGVLDHMDNVRGSKQYAMLSGSQYLLASAEDSLAAPPETDKWMPFAKGFGTWGNRDTEDDISGYNYDAYGIVAGLDKLVSENTLLGFSVGGSRANVDYSSQSASGDIDSLLVSLYGSYFKDTWHVDLTLGYAHNWYNSQRDILFDSIDRRAKSDHQGDSYAAAIELGNNFGGTDMLLEPVAGVGYTSVHEGSYTEDGAESLSLDVDARTLDGVYTKLGLRVGKEFRSQENPDVVWVPKANAFWIHDFADRVKLDSSFIGGGSFTTEGLEPLRDVFNLGAGLNIYFNKDVRLFVDYGWQTAGNFNSNTVQLGAQWSF